MDPERATARSTRRGQRGFCYEVPFSPDMPVFRSGQGLWLRADDGRSYLDGISSIFVTSFGHGCDAIVEAMTAQLRSLSFCPPLHGLNIEAMALAEEIVDMAGGHFDCVKLVNGGSESVEAALRMTRLYHRGRGQPQKTKVISNYHGYHGATYGSISLTGRPDVQRFEPRLPGFLHVWAPDCFACPLEQRYPACNVLCASMIEKTILAEGPESVGAIVIEPIIHLLGMVVPPREYFETLRAICDRHDIVLVFDEIVTGCGRTGAPFAAHTFGVEPDLMCVGKSLSGGYAPLAAVVMSEKLSSVLRDEETGMASFAPSHTYAGNPVSAAAGRQALKMMRDAGLVARIRERGRELGDGLRQAVGQRGRVRGVGLLYGIKLDQAPAAARGSMGKAVERACLERGLIVRGEADWIVVAPAYISSSEEIARICETVHEAIEQIWAG